MSNKFTTGTTVAYSRNGTGGTQLSFNKEIIFAIGTHDGNDSSVNIITAHDFTNFKNGKVGFKSNHFEECGCYYFIIFK